MIGGQFLFGFFKRSMLFRLALLMLFFIGIFGFIIHLIEPKQFSNFFEGIWWAIVTVSTVGYGDYAPETLWGRLLGILLILLGTGFFTTTCLTLDATRSLLSRQVFRWARRAIPTKLNNWTAR